MKEIVTTMIIVAALAAVPASATTSDPPAVNATESTCFRAGACGTDGAAAPGWSKVNKQSSGCDAAENNLDAYNSGAAQFNRIDRRSSSSVNLLRRYQRLCSKG